MSTRSDSAFQSRHPAGSGRGVRTVDVLEANRHNYEERYAKRQVFLRYPADWIIRFHNLYLKTQIPAGRVLDYGCGSGNNSVFFLEQGYETYGVEVAEAALPLIRENLQHWHLALGLMERFSLIRPESASLPFADAFFDVIVANQVLYYLGSAQRIRDVCREFSRCLRPGGVVFVTMMGRQNYFLTHHATAIKGGPVYEVTMDPAHRLTGLRQFIYAVRDQQELTSLFDEFECLSIGHFDQGIFDMVSNFHWIFIGRKPR